MRPKLFFYVLSLFLAGAAAAQQEAADMPLEVHVYPPGYEDRSQELDSFLTSGDYDAERHARFALPVAEDQFRAGDFAGAQGLLDETAERIREEGGETSLALAAVETARASLYEAQGELRKGVRHLKRARTAVRAVLGNDHPLTYRASLRIRNAELELKLSDTSGIEHFATVGSELERLAKRARWRFGDTHEVTVIAQLSRAIFEITRFKPRSAMRRVENVIDALEADSETDIGLLAAALVIKARFHDYLDETEAAEAAAMQLASILPDDMSPIRLFEAAADSELRAAAESELEYLRRMSEETSGGSTSSLAGSWADVSFCVDSQGRPQNVAVIATGGPKTRSTAAWMARVSEVVRARRYTGFSIEDGGTDCRPKLERLIINSPRINHAGSRIFTKSADLHIVREDLFRQGLDGGYLLEGTGDRRR